MHRKSHENKMLSTRINITRVCNLRKLITQYEGVSNLAEKLGYANSSFLVQMAGPHPDRAITERTARKIEQTLELSDRWLDNEELAVLHDPKPNNDLVRKSIQATAAAIEAAGKEMSATKIGDLALLVYEDAVEHGAVREEYIATLMRIAG